MRTGSSACGGVGPGRESGLRRRRTDFGARGALGTGSWSDPGGKRGEGGGAAARFLAAEAARVGPGWVAGERAEGWGGKFQHEDTCWRRQGPREKRTEMEPERPESTWATQRLENGRNGSDGKKLGEAEAPRDGEAEKGRKPQTGAKGGARN